MLEKGDDVLLLDVACPFENASAAYDEARLIKERKYAPLVSELSSRFRTVKFDAISVGSLVSWDPANDKIVASLCSRKYSTLMRKLIVSDTIHHSRDIYTQFITGVRQCNMNQATQSNDETGSQNSSRSRRRSRRRVTFQADDASRHTPDGEMNVVQKTNVIQKKQATRHSSDLR